MLENRRAISMRRQLIQLGCSYFPSEERRVQFELTMILSSQLWWLFAATAFSPPQMQPACHLRHGATSRSVIHKLR